MTVLQKILNWFENYWYYYKWRVIVAAFLLVVILFCVVQCATQERYAIFITYAGPDHIAARIDDIRSAVKSTFTTDEEKNAGGISVRDIIWVNSKLAVKYTEEGIYYNAAQNADNAKLLYNEAAAGDSFIYIIDREQYLRLKGEGLFTPLSEVFGNNLPAAAYDECGVKFKDTGFAKFFSCFEDLDEDLILCLRTKELSVSLVNRLKGKRAYERSYSLHKQIFTDIVNFEVK